MMLHFLENSKEINQNDNIFITVESVFLSWCRWWQDGGTRQEVISPIHHPGLARCPHVPTTIIRGEYCDHTHTPGAQTLVTDVTWEWSPLVSLVCSSDNTANWLSDGDEWDDVPGPGLARKTSDRQQNKIASLEIWNICWPSLKVWQFTCLML